MKLLASKLTQGLKGLFPLKADRLINSLSDAVIVIEKSNRLKFTNAHWTELSGYTMRASYKKLFSDFIHPEDCLSWQDALQKFYHSNKTQLLWLRVIDKKEDVHWCEMRVQPVYDDQAFPLSATLCDITPQIRSDQIKEARYRSLNSLINRIPAMLYRSRNNIHWTMEYVSDGCQELTGYQPKKMVNNAELSYGSLIHPDDQESVWRNVQASIQSDQCFEITYRLIHASGETRQVHEKGCAIYSETGAILGIEGVIFTLDHSF